MSVSGKRVMSGTWGQVWVDGELWAELNSFQAKYSYNKETIQLCGDMVEDSKVTSVKGTGSITIHKVYTRNITRFNSLIEGVDIRATIVAKLDDPDAFGAERVALYDVSFDDETVSSVQKELPRGTYEIRRLSQLTGEPVTVELRGLPYGKAQELREMEEDQEVMILLAGCPELKEAGLSAKFGGVTPAETVKEMLLPGEIADLSRAVERLSGYRQNTISEVKN